MPATRYSVVDRVAAVGQHQAISSQAVGACYSAGGTVTVQSVLGSRDRPKWHNLGAGPFASAGWLQTAVPSSSPSPAASPSPPVVCPSDPRPVTTPPCTAQHTLALALVQPASDCSSRPLTLAPSPDAHPFASGASSPPASSCPVERVGSQE